LCTFLLLKFHLSLVNSPFSLVKYCFDSWTFHVFG
jgi:hypothetical protein